jgi:putative ABC transport system substrate-binding protein
VVQAAKNATTTIPMVMLGAADPVGSGFVASLARPGGNITGNSNINPELVGERFELLREIIPKLSRVTFLAHGGDPAHKLFVKEARGAAEGLKIQIRPTVIGKVEEIEAAFSSMNRERAEALIVQTLFISILGQGQKITDLAVNNHLPSISDGAGFAEAGGCCSTHPISFRAIGVAQHLSTKSSKVPSPPTFRSSSRRNSSW